MNKITKLKEFNPRTRAKIRERDGGCIFCQIGYRMEKANSILLSTTDIMHFVPRSSGGLGTEENGAVGCRYHHHMLDNGNEGARPEMMDYFEEHLKNNYPEWDRNRLHIDKEDWKK